ncbi:MAG: CRTAC1 family protein [Deltaproteobacteria bacterium]|nr:CRTAC1 family protein [Deltaproteobacteria bacterium]
MLQKFSRLKGCILVAAIFFGGWLIRSGSTPRRPADAPKPAFQLQDVTREMGITFRYKDPVLDPQIQAKMRLIFLGSGVAVADFNGDGWMDILLVSAGRDEKNHLYLNQHGNGFKEVAEEWGIADTNRAGATVTPVVFDYDNDGRPDVYLARLGCSMLFHNLGDHFENVSKSSGLGDCLSSAGAVPIDYDGDGLIYLYVLRYWKPLNYFALPVPTPRIWLDGLGTSRNGGDNTLYRNQGDGTFKNVTPVAGGSDTGWSLDGGAADVRGDGLQRLYISNDFGPDSFWTAKDRKLIDSWSRSFPSVDRRSGMGVSFGDLAHDGRPHIHVSNENSRYYEPELGNYLFKFSGTDDLATESAYAWGTSKCGTFNWGSAFADFDLDGSEDLFVTNGFISGDPKAGDYEYHLMSSMSSSTDLIRMPDLKRMNLKGHDHSCMFWNREGHFENVAEAVGLVESWDGRAAGMIDFDNNGSMDLIVTTQNGPPHLLRNTVKPGKRWIELSLVGTRSNRDGTGAVIELRQPGQRPQYRWATGGKSGLMASSDPRIHFGLPVEADVDIMVRWPSGMTDHLNHLAPGQIHLLKEGGSP